MMLLTRPATTASARVRMELVSMAGRGITCARRKALSTMVRLCISLVSRHRGNAAASAQVVVGPFCRPADEGVLARRSKK